MIIEGYLARALKKYNYFEMNVITKILDSKTPIIIIGTFLLIFFVYKNYKINYHLKYYPKNSIGKTIKISRSGNARYIDYIFYDKGKMYKSTEALNDKNGEEYIDKFFKVTYSFNDPEISILFLEEEIKDMYLLKKAGFKK